MKLSSTVLVSALAGSAMSLSYNKDAAEIVMREANSDDKLIFEDKRTLVSSITSTPALFDKFIYFVFLDHGFHTALINSLIDLFTAKPEQSVTTLMNGISGTDFAQSLYLELYSSSGNDFLLAIAPVYNCGCEASSTDSSSGSTTSSGMSMSSSTYGTSNCMSSDMSEDSDSGSFVGTIFLGIMTGSIIKDTFETIEHDACLIFYLFYDIGKGNLMNVADLGSVLTSSSLTSTLLDTIKNSGGTYKNDIDTWVNNQGSSMVDTMKGMA